MVKRLILSVVSSQRDSLGADYTHTFVGGVGSIGRDEACEWPLPDAAVSRRHAAVRLLNGTFFIEDLSTNGTYVGGSDESHRLVKNQPRPLRDGDQIFIGDYQIVASLEDASVSAETPEDATAIWVQPPEPPTQRFEPAAGDAPGSLTPDEPLVPSPGGEVDPLKLLAASAASPHAPAAPPRAPVSPPDAGHSASGGEVAPGNGLDEPMPPLSPVPPVDAGGGQIPADWWKQTAEPAPPAAAPPPAPAPREPFAPAGAPAPGMPGTAGANDDALVRELVAGLMEVLAARAEIKRRFRVTMTMIQARENNPLKFAVNADEAMAKLFGGVSNGYLGPKEAFDEAFRDLKAHQIAMLAGMREAFDKMLNQFDPHRLEARFENTLGKGKLPFVKDRHWKLYKELFDELTADAEDSFHHLFGNAFATAYEQEMQKLISRYKRGG